MKDFQRLPVIEYFAACFLLVSTCGCSSDKSYEVSFEEILYQNPKLNAVLNRYKHDSLKLLAAKFLVGNLPYHYSYEGKVVDDYHKLYELHSTGKFYPEKVLDSISSKYGAFDYSKAAIKSDINIDTSYLIDNIDWAFKVWREQPWGKNVSFENFCEYILPYRIADEKLIPWRKKIYEQFNPVLDSIRKLPEAEDPLIVSQIMLKHLKERFPFYFSYIFIGPHVGPEIVNWYSGYCRESTDILIYVFRALGIPCGRDFMVVRGNENTGHEWNFILDKSGNNYFCSVTYTSKVPELTDTYFWSKGKVHRERFGLNKSVSDKIGVGGKNVHPYFRIPQFIDVTRYYTGKRNHTVTIPASKLYHKQKKGELIYLCSSSKQDWIPLDFSIYKKDSIKFQDVEGGVVFRLAVYKNERVVPLTPPFLLDKEKGSIRYFEPGMKTENVVLFHKYALHWAYPWNMLKGVFEAANTPSFKEKDTLFLIKDRPQRMWNVARIMNEKKYTYLRYVGPEKSNCNVAEIAFFENYNDTTPVPGAIIGTPNENNLNEKNQFTNAFDGDIKTSFSYHLPDGGWVGLKLNKPQKVEKIVYTARDRDNFIQKGNTYELFYDKEGVWFSLGKKIAASDSLVYTIPQNALLYLKNHSQGKDERIFEYNERFNRIEQIFW